MPAYRQRQATQRQIDERRLVEAIALARRLRPKEIPAEWDQPPDPRGIDKAGIQQLLARELGRDTHPVVIRRRTLRKALRASRARTMYWRMRRHLWNWPEFLRLREKARMILEIVIELAREEAFPWYVAVPARDVQKLARLNHASYTARVQELECFVITRPARRIHLEVSPGRLTEWPNAENNWLVDEDQPLTPIPQWVVRYRRGIPHNANRAGWWINYDLLCGTRRVLPCFEVSTETLAKDYAHRNQRMGIREGLFQKDRLDKMSRLVALRGPLPPLGLRAPLWEGMKFSGTE
ncbi:MAG: hypothetical protein EA377_12430 [Phycisphaerales bacterium]|nr:MAG: hypothetical protein EA377_12430 [Phycisphaerales bacterium]